jgi:septal ring factor EnvC (AmiA/AmiB activator)
MKKVIATALLGFAMLAGTSAFAQDSYGQINPPTKTEQVIAAIPSLQNIKNEIAQFEAKTEGKKDSFENGNADLKALKMKYATELETQIGINKDNKEVLEILNAELKKTREEIEKLK